MRTMKLKVLILCIVVSGIVALTASPAKAVIILYQSANTDIYLGEPYGNLEFENPLAGTEKIKEYAVIEWLDADYDAGPPRWYDDWSVSDPLGIDGYANEIWMRWGGHSIWTSSTVPSKAVSIHLHGDYNDGLADVLVDGILVARLDMGTPSPAVQNALIIVKDLAHITHHIRVNDLGAGNETGGDDVATMGAAALEKRIKWSQPPKPAEPNNLYYGWNEISIYDGNQIVADDWRCDNEDPITDIHWWGSFKGWNDANYPPDDQIPTSFHITIWNDIPDPSPDDPNTFSHPNEVVWEIDCHNFTKKFVGWDYDPRTNCFETCFYYEQDLTEAEYFYQPFNPDGTPSIYWISIAANYPAGTTTENQWGWKTRRRLFNDDAVKIRKPNTPHIGDKYEEGKPIYWPDPTQSWDMAFELTSRMTLTANKWLQPPNQELPGIHCHDYINLLGGHEWTTIADDWRCDGGVVTEIHWWGNYETDAGGNEMRGSEINKFHLSIHDPDPTVNCLPEQNEFWGIDVPLGDVTVIDTGLLNNENSKIYRYEYVLPTPFPQELDRYYWLDITAFANDPQDPARWRWQESKRDIRANINLCPAVKRTEPPVPGPWQTIIWGLDPERYSDMAFAILSTGFGPGYVKWSQKPEPYRPKAYDGWNELSVYHWNQIVADDWRCDTDNPVTDVHWWGSFLGWSCEDNPPQIPDSFHIAIWTDVPAGADQNPDVWFSHPGKVIWETVCNNFTSKFVGWDIDRRDPNAPPEACFKFEQDLPEAEWFYQKPGGNIYWISIAAQYPTGTDVKHAWGWKTRLRDPDSQAPDDAVRINNPTDPVFGSPYLFGEPIYWPTRTQSWDMAFELTTKEIPPKKPVPHLKWSQPPIEVDPNSEIPEYSGWDQPSYATPIAGTSDTMRIVADDYRCLGSMPVTSIHWWGSYFGMTQSGMIPPQLPTSWKFGFWSNVPAPDGEWDLGDPHKMHYPQLPDPCGWDLDITYANKSADDWKCEKSGPVSDIHFWYSWQGDIVGTIEAIKVEIYDNEPEDPGDPTSFSHPRTLQWNRDFLPGEFTTRFWGKGNQGFITPGTSPIYDDHKNIYQCNIVNIPQPFYQTQGEIYWLAITIHLTGVVNARIGWKTTLESLQYEDDAVYRIPGGWAPWTDPDNDDVSLDLAFVITDDIPYSHPEKLLWQIEVPAELVEVEEVGTDFYHNYYPNDVAFQYTLHLNPDEFFWQGDYLDDTTDDIFWLSIVAVYDSAVGTDPEFPWGWKTRPWHWMDDAVTFPFEGPLDPGMVVDPETMTPIKDPLYFESFDVAFELDTDPNYIKWEQPFIGIRRWPHYEDEKSMATVVTTTENVIKWAQGPDLTNTGIDVDATHLHLIVPTPDPQLLADDFNCVSADTIDDIHIYGSWRLDEPPNGDPTLVDFTLSIHKDIPAEHNPNGYSMPGDQIWSEDFDSGDFTVDLIPTTERENYYMPCTGDYYESDHTNVYKYNFYPTNPFPQEGSPDNPIIYWLDVQARPRTQNQDTRFGWKTRDPINEEQFNDDATWVGAVDPYNGDEWQELTYPTQHPLAGRSMDLAFELTSNVVTTELVIHRLVADDWKCKKETPVTDAVWWGSYIGYQYKPCHGPFMPLPVKPDYFLLTIWNDVPAGADPLVPFSHPEGPDPIWKYKAYDYDEVLVGYDKHPHATPGATSAREPVFRYSVRIPKEKWFMQEDVNNIYWFSVVAVYEEGTDPLYDWGWTNHPWVFNDDAVAGWFDPAVGEWVWDELYDQIGNSQDMSFMLFTDPECLIGGNAGPLEYSDWVAWGKPDCWCYRKQCRGDINGTSFFGKPVTLSDLNTFKLAFNQPDPNVMMIPGGICADLNHKAFFGKRVTLGDLNIFKQYFNLFEVLVPICDQPPIYTGPYNFWTKP